MKVSGKSEVKDAEVGLDNIEETYIIQSTIKKGNKWVKDRLFFGDSEEDAVCKFNTYYMERGFYPEEVELVT